MVVLLSHANALWATQQVSPESTWMPGLACTTVLAWHMHSAAGTAWQAPWLAHMVSHDLGLGV